MRLLPKLGEQAEKPLLYALLHKLSAQDGFAALKNTASLARRLFEATFPKLHLEIGDLEDQSQRTPQGLSNFSGASNGSSMTSSVTGFVNLLENCFMNGVGADGLEDRGMELLRNSHESLSEAYRRFPQKGSNHARLRPWGAPVVTDRAPGEELLVALVVIMHKYQLVDPPPFVRDLFLLLFTRYILPDQPNNPPQRPRTWRHKPRFCYKHDPSRDKIHGTCHQCALIQDFIRAPDQAKGHFSYGKEIRRHLESVLPSQHYRCATDTTSGKGRCHTLVVTKIGKETEYKEEMKEFEDKMRLYEKRLLGLRQPIVQRLLGNETYQSLIMVDSAPYAASATHVPAKRGAGESQDQPASTRQRTDDVIDLTEE